MILFCGLNFLPGEKYFDQPDKFRPERFINEKGEVFAPEAFIPFGYGKLVTGLFEELFIRI